MISRMISAAARALLVAMVIVLPSMALPSVAADSTQVVSLIAFVAAGLTFVEYFSTYPSIVEFRDAPPFNRLRFLGVLFAVMALTMICRDKVDSGPLTAMAFGIGTQIGHILDFPYSPVRMVVLMLPSDAPLSAVGALRTAAGVAYLLSIITLGLFLYSVYRRNWPNRSGTFNVWVNLPLFDPTAGGDVLYRLKRDANVNIALGFLLPFLIPAAIKMASDAFDPLTLINPQTLVWCMTAWAFLPTSLLMRGVALGRVADMIERKRKRAYAKAEQLHSQAA